MKHISIVQDGTGDGLKEKAEIWIEENVEKIQEIVNIEYSEYGSIYSVTITYEEK